MTAINIFPLRDVAYLFSDGASYDLESRLLSIEGKTEVLSSISTAMLFTGRSILSPYIVHHLQRQAESFDHLMEIMPDRLEGIEDHLTDLFGVDQSPARKTAQQGYRIFCAGWSESRQRIVTFSICSTSDTLGDAYTIHEAPNGLQSPPVTNEQRMLGFGAAFPDVTPETIEDVALTQIELQRQFGHQNIGSANCTVGGLVELVTVRKDHVDVKILKRWNEDTVGETMQPKPVDWAAWRAARKGAEASSALAASGVDLTSLSRLQRERMEKKARKGTLRAV